VAQGVGPEFKPHYWKNKRKNKTNSIARRIPLSPEYSSGVRISGEVVDCELGHGLLPSL
jgi:hypothetical protein